jgi:hypothetical protein
MKIIQYTLDGLKKTITWSEVNELVAAKEADNGEYIIVDDGQPEPETPSEDSVWDELDEAYQRGVDSV